MQWIWIKWGALTASAVLSCWPIDVVLKSDPPATSSESVRFMRHYLAHINRKTPAGIAMVRMPLLPYLVAHATGAREASGVRRVLPPLVVDFSRNPRKLEPTHIAPDIARAMGRSPDVGEKLAVSGLDTLTLAALSSGDDIERLGEIELRLPDVPPVIAVRAGPIVHTPERPIEPDMLSWSDSIVGQPGSIEFAVGLKPFTHATISETTAAQSIAIAPAPFAPSATTEYILDRTPGSASQEPAVVAPNSTTPLGPNLVATVGESKSGCVEDTIAAPDRADMPTIHILPIVTRAVSDLLGSANVNDDIATNERQVNNALFWSNINLRVKFLPAEIVDDQTFGTADDKALMEALLDAARRFQRSAARVLRVDELSDLVPAYKELRRLRDDAKADVVVVLLDRSPQDGGGWTAAIPANDILFYSIVNGGQDATVVGSGNPLQHEIGHLFGGRHGMEESPETAPPSSHGYGFHDGKLGDVGTMMTRNVKRIWRYSNPHAAPCNGVRLGVPRVTDEAQAIEANGGLVALLHIAPGTLRPPAADAAVCRELLNAPAEPETRSCGTDSPTVFYFESGKAALSPKEKARVDDFISNHLLRAFDNAGDRADADVTNNVRTFAAIPVVVLEGHASYSTGSREINDWYSFERAQAISDRIDALLTKRHRLPVFICAYGNQRPTCTEGNGDKKGASGNQRAEISIAFIPPNPLVSPSLSSAAAQSPSQTQAIPVGSK
jgi:outer membrane protein OmpA-like peptidoglycan-associated protein